MSDSNYQGRVAFEQGGTRLTVPNGCELLLEGSVRGLIKGRAFYVDSAVGSNSNDGSSWTSAVATLNYAIGLCTASRGDVIYVAPGHVETITGAAGVAVNVAGISIIGLGNGHLRPKMNMTTAITASFDVSAANVLIQNLWFNSAFDAQTAMVNVTAADVTFRDCEWMIADATYQAVLGLLGSDAADRLTIENCFFRGSTDAGTTSAISYGACDHVTIRNNRITGKHTTAGSIANTAAAVGGVIDGNFIVNETADANNMCIVLHSSSNSLIANNRLACIDSTSPIPITAAAGYIAGNYIVGAVGTTASVLK